MKNKFAVTGLLLVCVWSYGVTIIRAENCKTPENRNGRCIAIHDCPELLRLLEKGPVSQEIIDYLRKLHCGFEGKKPTVCCANAIGDDLSEPGNLFPTKKVCGHRGDDRIIGGEQTSIRTFPWLALLEYEKPTTKEFDCGGALINKRYILTAAHCLFRIKEISVLTSVRLGEYNLTQEKDCEDDQSGFEDCNSPIDVGVGEQIAHEQYDPQDINQYHDIALLRLTRDIQYNDFIQPICLPFSEHLKTQRYLGQRLTAAGWGRTETRKQSPVKLKVQVPVRNMSDCDTPYRRFLVNLISSQICAGGEAKKDFCGSDSGGPLMAIDRNEEEENYIEYGVVSMGPDPCGIENFPGIYTRVADYIDWIVARVKP